MKSSNNIATKDYVDALAQGIEFIESSSVPHPNSYGKDGQTYYCISTDCFFMKVAGMWTQLTDAGKHIYMWCMECRRNYKLVVKQDACLGCGEPLITLDITEDIFQKLDDFCTKAEIVEAALGEEGGL